ncbi:hypothetical protein BH10PSE16_BH10PSE16_28810 [soil metagenome]
MDSQIFTVLIAVAGLVAGFVLCWLLMRGRTATPAPQPQARPEAQAELAQAKERVRQLEQERQAAVKSYEDLKQQTAKSRETLERAQKEQAAPAANTAPQLAALQEQEKAARAEAAKARADAQAEQAQAKEYFRSIEQKHQLAATEHQELKLQAAKLREALEQAKKAPQVPLAPSREPALEARVQALEQENAMLKRAAAAAPASPRPATQPAQATQLPMLEKQVIELQTLEKAIQKEFKLLAELQRNVTLTSATIKEFNESPESERSAPAAA